MTDRNERPTEPVVLDDEALEAASGGYVWKLTNVHVSSYSTHGSAGDAAEPAPALTANRL